MNSSSRSPSRDELLAGETKLSPVPGFRRSDRGLALVFPNTYRVGMSSLGFLTVRRLIEAIEGWRVERAFSLPADTSRGPRTLESDQALTSFDIAAFALSAETDCFAVAETLFRAGIPVLAAERDDRHPLILMGGAAISLNPEPFAEVADVMLLGEAESVLEPLLTVLADDECRASALEEAAAIEGVYVPSLYTTSELEDGTRIPMLNDRRLQIQRAFLADMEPHPIASDILTPHTEFADTRLIEISRGCSRRCRFCIVSAAHGGSRFRSADSVISLGQGHGKVGLLGASAADHPELLRIITSLTDADRQLTLSASRADALQEDVIRALGAGGQRTLTLAPETVDPNVRKSITKGVTPERVLEVAATAESAGIRNLKLYFILGLPSSTDDEADGIVEFAIKLARETPKLNLSVSASVFVPKPHTPFEREAAPDLQRLGLSMRTMERGLKTARLGISPRSASRRHSVVETLITRGDRRIGGALKLLSEVGRSSPQPLVDAMAQCGINTDRLLARIDDDAALPWHVVGLGGC